MTTTIDILEALDLDGQLSADEAFTLADEADHNEIARYAARRRDYAHGDAISYSRKVFLPLTKLCRDVCHYCTFARSHTTRESSYLSLEEVRRIAQAGRAAGCKEALFTLGDKPEVRHRQAREKLDELGYETTIAYLAQAARAVFEETGLFPHLNPGLLTAADLSKLKKVSLSQGIMLESASERLLERGGPISARRTNSLSSNSRPFALPEN